MNRELRFVLPLVWIGGALAVGVAGREILEGGPRIFEQSGIWLTLLLVLAIISEIKPVPYTLGHADKEESLTITIILLTLFTYGLPLAVLLAFTSVVVADIAESKPHYKIFFNGSMYALAATAAGVVHHAGSLLMEMVHPALSPIWLRLPVWFVAGAMYYLVNLGLLMLVLSRVQGVRWRQMLLWGLRDSAMVNLALICIAMAMSALWGYHPLAAAVLVPPLFMAKYGYQGYTRLRKEAEAMLATLVDILDLRDHYTGQHSFRVSEMCYGVARTLQVPEEQALAIQAIARVHDVGKVAVRDAVLLKAGTLSGQERLEIQSHVDAGGRILSHLSVYKPQLPILMQHHERLDGGGYPQGLRAEGISLGARILAVCDAFDTMTSERPYRSAVPREAAIDELYRSTDTHFDRSAVEALERWLIEERRLRADWRSRLGSPAGDPALAAEEHALNALLSNGP